MRRISDASPTSGFYRMGLHEPPTDGPTRARAMLNPIIIRGRTNDAGVRTPDHLALLVGDGEWAVWQPRRELPPEQREAAVKELTRMAPNLGEEAKAALREWIREGQQATEEAA